MESVGLCRLFANHFFAVKYLKQFLYCIMWLVWQIYAIKRVVGSEIVNERRKELFIIQWSSVYSFVLLCAYSNKGLIEHHIIKMYEEYMCNSKHFVLWLIL
jgi:hypothetical protein